MPSKLFDGCELNLNNYVGNGDRESNRYYFHVSYRKVMKIFQTSIELTIDLSDAESQISVM